MLKTDLIIVLKATVVLICMWFMDNSDILELDFDYISRFQWRSEGTIDSVRTAQALVSREDAPATMRRTSASSYCLEVDVRRLEKIWT
ncbi:hypothetical protein CEXT_806701 [Caerostris extrusa]|uniref:Uncharacterized protein n=1 Tax=Caerostris extrusa TaxID=172846 RepID=A0AAV4M912_CAEEX|nr:hypothetical protein CEXT_806701 [Caerostris extrusa]